MLWMLPILYIFLPDRFQLFRCCCRRTKSDQYGLVNKSDERSYSDDSSTINDESDLADRLKQARNGGLQG